MKYLLIDGNNLGARAAFGNSELKNSLGIPTGTHFGVFNSLITLKSRFPDYQFLMVWDSKSLRRINESLDGVAKGIIKSSYKENRKREEQPQPLKDFHEQMPFLKKGIDALGIPQIRIQNYEADDVIASYAVLLKDHENLIVSSDFDHMQNLKDNVSIYDGMKDIFITKDGCIKEYGIEPEQFIDVGALSGDTSDNIFGVNGIGETTAIKIIQQYGTYQKYYEYLHGYFDNLRNKYADLQDITELASIKTESGKAKYPDIIPNLPFSGVTLAFEKGSWKPDKSMKSGLKATLNALMFEERVKLAYSLKKMDILNDLPNIPKLEYNIDRVREYLNYYEIKSLMSSVDIFVKG